MKQCIVKHTLESLTFGFPRTGAFVAAVGAVCFIAALFLIIATPNPYAALGVPVAAVALYYMFTTPRPFLLLIVLLIPFAAWQAYSRELSFFSISKVVGIVLVITVAARVVAKRKELWRFSSPLWKHLFLYVFIVGLAGLRSVCPADTVFEYRSLLQTLSFVALVVYFSSSSRFYAITAKTVVVGATISSLIAIGGVVLGARDVTMSMNESGLQAVRAVGGDAGPNILAASMLFALPLLNAFFHSTSSARIRVLLAAAFACNVAAIILTYSRAAYLVLGIAGVLIAVDNLKRFRFRHFGFYLAAAIVFAVVMLKVVPASTAATRLASLSAPHASMSLLRRGSYYVVAKESFVQRPLLGWGLSAYPHLYAKSRFAPAFTRHPVGFYREAHNTFLQILVESGIIGLAAFGLLIIMCFRAFFADRAATRPRCAVDLQRAFGYSLLLFLLSLLFVSYPYHKFLWLPIALAMGLGQKEPEPERPGA